MDSPNSKGFGFRPTDEDIIDYLKDKRRDPDFSVQAIPELDIYKFDPWELPGFSATPSKKEVRYFYYKPRCKYANSKLAHRKTNTGYWKSTGNVRDMKADSGEVIGTKRYLPFYSKNSGYKKAKTKWVMHEISVKDDAVYKKEFVICRIERKWNKKLGISNSDEGESSKQVVSPTQVLLPGDHSISNGNHIDENIVTDPQLPPPNDNVISSYPGNHIEQTSLSSHKPLPNHNMVSDPGNRIEQITFSNTQLLPHYNMVPFPENHFGQNTLSNPQLLPPNHKFISPPGNHMGFPDLQQSPPNHNMNSYPGNHILQNTLSNPQLLPLNHNLISSPGNHILHNTISTPPLLPNHNPISCCGNQIEQNINIQLVPYPNLTSYPRNQIKENTLTNPQGLSNYNMISFPWNHIEDKTSTGLQLPPNSVSQLLSKNTSQEEKHQLEEFNASGGYNGLNHASFSTPQSSNYQEMELLQLPPNSASQLVSINTSQEEEKHQLEEFNASSGYNGLNHASFSTPQSLNYQEMEFLQLPPNSVSQLVSKNTSQEEENHQLEEFNASSGYNGLNYASFSTPQSPNYQEMELSYSNSSIDNCDFLNFQLDSEQVIDLINSPRAFLDENSLEETGQTHTPDLTLTH